MRESKIKTIEFLDNYQIKIFLENEHCIIYNMKPRLETARFHDLCDPVLFSKGRLSKGNIIRWDYNMELSLDEILKQVMNNFMNHELHSPEDKKG